MNNDNVDEFEFLDGAHSGDAISRMSNDTLLFEAFIAKRKAELHDELEFDADNFNYNYEIINEICYRIRSDSLNLGSPDILSQLLRLDNNDIFTSIIEYDLETSVDIIEQSFKEDSTNDGANNFYKIFLRYYTEQNKNMAHFAFSDLFKRVQGTDTPLEKDVLSRYKDFAFANLKVFEYMEKHIPIDLKLIEEFIFTENKDKYKLKSQDKEMAKLILRLNKDIFIPLEKAQKSLQFNSSIIPQFIRHFPINSELFEFNNALNLIDGMYSYYLPEVLKAFPSNLLNDEKFIKRCFSIRDIGLEHLPKQFFNEKFILDLSISAKRNCVASFFTYGTPLTSYDFFFSELKKISDFSQMYPGSISMQNKPEIYKIFYEQFPYISKVTDISISLEIIDKTISNTFNAFSYFTQDKEQDYELNRKALFLIMNNSEADIKKVYSFYSDRAIYDIISEEDEFNYLNIILKRPPSPGLKYFQQAYPETFKVALNQFVRYLNTLESQHPNEGIQNQYLACCIASYISDCSPVKSSFPLTKICELDMNDFLMQISTPVLKTLLEKNILPSDFLSSVCDSKFNPKDVNNYKENLNILIFEKELCENMPIQKQQTIKNKVKF